MSRNAKFQPLIARPTLVTDHWIKGGGSLLQTDVNSALDAQWTNEGVTIIADLTPLALGHYTKQGG